MGQDVRIEDLDMYLFARGTHYEIYEKMGAHITEEKGESGTYFAVWAPNAKSVSVVGDFNDWKPGADPMDMVGQSGIWDRFIPGIGMGSLYKYAVEAADGKIVYKADPYGNASQMRPESASVVTDLNRYQWKDGAWLDKRLKGKDVQAGQPMSIYEVHLGSWKKDYAYPDGFIGYRRLADELADYEIGRAHV